MGDHRLSEHVPTKPKIPLLDHVSHAIQLRSCNYMYYMCVHVPCVCVCVCVRACTCVCPAGIIGIHACIMCTQATLVSHTLLHSSIVNNAW